MQCVDRQDEIENESFNNDVIVALFTNISSSSLYYQRHLSKSSPQKILLIQRTQSLVSFLRHPLSKVHSKVPDSVSFSQILHFSMPLIIIIIIPPNANANVKRLDRLSQLPPHLSALTQSQCRPANFLLQKQTEKSSSFFQNVKKALNFLKICEKMS